MTWFTELSIFASGLLIGLSLAAPVGPMAVLIIRRTLANGRWVGFISGLGTATADAIYGLIGALGVTTFIAALNAQATWLRLVGGLFLCYLGLRTFFSAPATRASEKATERDVRGTFAAYASSVGLTLTNPATILSFLGIFAGLSLPTGHGVAPSVVVVAGVFTGSALWWLALSGIVNLIRHRLHAQTLVWINRISGVLLAAFGLVALVAAVPAVLRMLGLLAP